MKTLNVIIGLVTVLGVVSSQAAGIILQGAVNSSAIITVTPVVGVFDNLNLGIDHTADLKVATVNEKCNKNNGYTVTLISAGAVSKGGGTAAKLVGALATPESLTYNIKYNTVAVTLIAGLATVTDASTKTLGQGVDKDLTITWLGATANLAADIYSDTLTLTIASR